MRVSELIKILERLDPDIEVLVHDYEWLVADSISVQIEDGHPIIHQYRVVPGHPEGESDL